MRRHRAGLPGSRALVEPAAYKGPMDALTIVVLAAIALLILVLVLALTRRGSGEAEAMR